MNWLLLVVAMPLLGAAVVWALADAGREAVRRVALATTLFTLALVAWVVIGHERAASEGSVAERYGEGIQWLGASEFGLDIRLSLGLDGLSLWLFAMTALLMITAVLVGWETIRDRAAAYYALLLVLESGMLGVFAARDIILFYIFFEFTLIPLFFLIGIWGGSERRYAAMKFFLYTLAGSLLTFLGLLALVVWNYYQSESGVLVFFIPDLQAGLAAHPIDYVVPYLNVDLGLLIFLALFAGFAIKVPLFPLHTWLPLAHVEAPTAGSVILAGVLLKIGTYGFVRFSLPMLPEAAARCMPWIITLATAGIIYGALVALAQKDIKRLIAYSSVSHLGFCMLGLFALNKAAIEGGILQMVNHGLSTAGLFALVGMIYDRYHTREIKDLGGLARRTPLLAAFMVLFALSSLGLPGLNGFAGEFLLLLGMFQRAFAAAPVELAMILRICAVAAVFGVVLGAWYLLWFVERVFFGPLREPDVRTGEAPPRDLSRHEIAALLPLTVFIVWIGVQPQLFLKPIARSADPIAVKAAQVFDRQHRETKSQLAASGKGTEVEQRRER